VRKSDRVQAHVGRPGAQPIFYFNKAKPPFDNTEKGILMRKAVQALTNAEEIMLGYGAKELWSLCPTMWFCDSFWDSREGTEAYNQKNVAKAKELLAQAGYAGEPVILIDPADFPTIHPIPIVLKNQLEAAGIKVDYRVMDWATETTIVLSQNPDDLNKWSIAPTWLSSVLLHPLNNTLIANGDLGRYQSERMDALRKQLADAVDPAEQKRLAAEIQKVFFDEAPYVHLGQFFQLRVLSKDLKGFVGAPVGSPYFANMYWDNPTKRR
jgi:peptide/nickel transport system substrate-binding protein